MDNSMNSSAQKPETGNLAEFKTSVFGLQKKDVYEYIKLQNDNLNKARTVYEEKLSNLKSENELLNRANEVNESKLKELKGSYDEIKKERDELKATITNEKNLVEELRNAKSENERLLHSISEYKNVQSENAELKKMLVENEADLQMKDQERNRLENEIKNLREQNKIMLFDFTEEKRQIEKAALEEKLYLSKAIKLHSLSVEQTKSTLDTLSSQFAEIIESTSRIKLD